MAGRALFSRLQLPDGHRRCAIFVVQEKVMHGTSRAADYRAYRRIAPKSLEFFVDGANRLSPGHLTLRLTCGPAGNRTATGSLYSIRDVKNVALPTTPQGRLAPKSLELVVVSKAVAFAFCGRLLLQQPAGVDYFDPAQDWPQPIELHATFSIGRNLLSLAILEVDVSCSCLRRPTRHGSH